MINSCWYYSPQALSDPELLLNNTDLIKAVSTLDNGRTVTLLLHIIERCSIKLKVNVNVDIERIEAQPMSLMSLT